MSMLHILHNNKEIITKNRVRALEKKIGIIELIHLNELWETRKYIFEFLTIEEAKELLIKLGYQYGSEKGTHNFLWGMFSNNGLTQERIISLIEECIGISPLSVFKEESSDQYYVILRLKEEDLLNDKYFAEFYSRISARWLLTGYLVGYLSVILLKEIDYKLSKVREFGEDVIYIQLIIKREAESENINVGNAYMHSLQESKKKRTKLDLNYIDSYVEEKFVSLSKEFLNQLNEFVIILKDDRGEIINVSKKVCESLGLKSEELIGKEINNLLPISKRDLKTLLKEAQKKSSAVIELPIKGKNGGNLDSGLRVTSVLLSNHYFYLCFLTGEQNTNRERASIQEFIEKRWWRFLENFSFVLKNIFDIEEDKEKYCLQNMKAMEQEGVISYEATDKKKDDFTSIILRDLEGI